jgi:L-ascorbate metabolism protein UlaG (beta-lactamase superfamily)
MEIVYLGHSCFKIKGKTAVVVTDPYGEKVGRLPRDVEASVVTVSHGHSDHAGGVGIIKGNPFVMDTPGEIEARGVSVVGIATAHDDKHGEERGTNTVFVIELEGLRVAHLGDLGHKLTTAQLEEIGPIDVVLVPVGGTCTIDAKTAVEVVHQVDPWVVIPMHYQQEGTEAAINEKLTPVADFLKEMGKTDVIPMAKYVISADKLPDDVQVVVLERK